MALSTDEIKIKNLLNMYDTLTFDQIVSIGNLITNQQRKIIGSLLKKKAIKQDFLEDGVEVCTNYYAQPNRKFALIGEVLKELMYSLDVPVLWFQKQEYPFTALAFMKNKMFDIAVIEEGEENVFNAVINRVISNETGTSEECINNPAQRENILIVIENMEQIQHIKIIHENVVFACVNLKESSVKFIR